MKKQPTKSVERLDAIQEPNWMSSKFEKTDEGYLKGRSIMTNIGVFIYFDAEGGEVRELRLPEEVFSRDTLATMAMLPLTLDHPDEVVNSENIKEHQVGYTGSNPSSYRDPEWEWPGGSDGIHVSNDIVITHKDAIEAVEQGKQALSCGYFADLEPGDIDAIWCGIPYDYIQRNIRYNHIAIVDKARAGDAARIRLDSAEAHQSKEVPMNLKKITLDGVEYEAEGEVIKALNSSKTEVETLKTESETVRKDTSKVEAERDTFKDENERLTKENKELKEQKLDSAEVDKRLKSLVQTRAVAEQLGVEIKDEMSELDIKKATILAKYPKAELDKKDEVYIQARFDGISELIEDENDSEESIRSAGAANDAATDKDGKVVNAEEKRDAMVVRNHENSRKALVS